MMKNHFPTEGRTQFYQQLRAWAAEVEELLEALTASEPPAQPEKAEKPSRRGKDARDDSILDLTAEKLAETGNPDADNTED